ncbi:MAG: hypothetical protein HY401_06635 [Elusimicrobia bacterium]|nr:hypothetical protein [Elusimicrobiota bacterium]
MKHLGFVTVTLWWELAALSLSWAGQNSIEAEGADGELDWQELLGLSEPSASLGTTNDKEGFNASSTDSEFSLVGNKRIQNPDFSYQGMSCRWTNDAGQGVECGDDKGYGFSTTCELKPDLCAQGRTQTVGGNDLPNTIKVGNYTVNLPPYLNNGQPVPAPPSNETAAPGSTQPSPKQEWPTDEVSDDVETRKIPVDQAVRLTPLESKEDDDRLADLPSDLLDQAKKRLNGMIDAAREGAAQTVNAPRKLTARLQRLMLARLKLWHAIAHNISHRQVIERLPEKYYIASGMMDRPEKPQSRLWLNADENETMLGPLLRDVTLAEECLGWPSGRGVRHVEMMAQCVGVPFGEKRLFVF